MPEMAKGTVVESKDVSNLIIVRVDGGICSQIAFCALGLALQRRGYKVKYDLSFYRDNGLDADGRFARNWDMPQAFPTLDFEAATEEEVATLKRITQRRSELISSWTPPLYVGGYPDRTEPVLEFLPLFREHFHPDVSDVTARLLQKVDSPRACAVHVRRGDLGHESAVYGKPTSVGYYERAMAVVAAYCPGACFCLFSDEPLWAREHVLPRIPAGCEGVVMEANGSDCGYLDLYLMAQCPYVISSIGSLGVYGALLSSRNRLLVLSRFSMMAMKGAPNVIYMVEEGAKLNMFHADVISCAIPEAKLHGLWYCVYRLWRKLGLWLSDGTVRIEIFPAR